jgi:hypothetical protein
MKKLLPLLSLLVIFSFPTPANAVCPVCTVAVGAGLGLCRFLGIDDTVSGIWIGGLILSSGLWLADWIGKRKWNVPHKEVISVLLFYLFVIPPLYWAKMIGLSGNTLWGIDKTILGIFVGSMLFIFSVWTDKFLRSKNNGVVYIYYQKVILPILYLTIASFIFYLITC